MEERKVSKYVQYMLERENSKYWQAIADIEKLSDKDLLNVWKNLFPYHRDEMYNEEMTMDEYAEAVYSTVNLRQLPIY